MIRARRPRRNDMHRPLVASRYERRGSSKRRTSYLCLLGLIALDVYGFAAEARQAPLKDNQAITSRPPLAPTSAPCPATQHLDPRMGMCMPNAKILQAPSPPGKAVSPPSRPAETPSLKEPRAAPNPSPTTMSMPMPGGAESNSGAMIRLNQFMLYSHTSGPRGRSRLTGPGMWMLMYDKDLSSRNHLSVDMMGTPEHLTVGDRGTPQLLQTENIDAMHPHDYIMAVELRDSLTLNAEKNERLTFLFAPRGEAAIGPVPFMHRESAEGNPDSPLGHALQDGFHDVSTVLGVEYQFARTTIEATAFSGHDIVWPLPLHRPDSYGLRVNQQFNEHLGMGASFADALLPKDTGGAEHSKFVAAWLNASYRICDDTLKFTIVWGRGQAGRDAPLNSFLEEASFQKGRNKLYNRAEVLQITPAQLELLIPDSSAGRKWAGALTVGYERTLFEKSGLALLAGGSYTKDFIPKEFNGAYGSDPGGEKVYLRVAFHGAIH